MYCFGAEIHAEASERRIHGTRRAPEQRARHGQGERQDCHGDCPWERTSPWLSGGRHGRTLFEQTSPADGGRKLPNGRALPRLYIPEGGTSLEEVEHSMVELAMNQANGNQTNAAKLLDISRDALHYKLKKFALVPDLDE